MGFIWTVSILLAIHLGIAVVLVRRAQRWMEAVFAIIVLGSLWVVLSLAAVRIFIAPQSVWNDARLGEVIATLKHYPLYIEPGTGPILSYKYGPIGAFAYLLAGLAKTPTGQILLGSLLTSLYFYLPVVWVIRRAAGKAQVLNQIAAFTCFAAVVHNSYTLSSPSSWIHTDAPALGFAACSLALALNRPGSKRSNLDRIGMALFAVLAAWAKQTVAPILVVLPIWTLLTQGRREATRDAACILLFLAVASVALVDSFNSSAMHYYMLTEPEHHPWQYGGHEAAVATIAVMILRQVWPIALLLTAVVGLQADPNSGATRASVRTWLNQHGWALAVLYAFILAPSALFGWLKAGGAENNAALITYFLLIAAISALAQFQLPRFVAKRPDARIIAQAMIVLLVAQFSVRAFFDDYQFDAELAQAMQPAQNDSEMAYLYEKAHPGDVYFPWNVEASLLASNKLYDFDYGVHDRILAGNAPNAAELKIGLPANMRAIAYPPQVVPSLDMLQLLAQYRKPLHIPGLQGFIVYGIVAPPPHPVDDKRPLQVSLSTR
jgi:hypothetical protein